MMTTRMRRNEADSRRSVGGGRREGWLEDGKTDDCSYNIAENPVHVRDFHATAMRCLGFDHERLTVPFGGLDVKLTGWRGRGW